MLAYYFYQAFYFGLVSVLILLFYINNLEDILLCMWIGGNIRRNFGQKHRYPVV